MEPARRTMSLHEFLDWEERQERPFEFNGFQPVAMTGGTVAHDRITFNVQKALDLRLAGSRCRPFGPNVKIVASGRVRYPDAFVSCKPVAPGATLIDDPVVVFEVVSEDTARTDRIEKLREYQATPSIRQYVILEQKSVGAVVFVREGSAWTAAALAEGETLSLPAVGIEIPLAELYAGIDFEAGDVTQAT